MENTGKHPGRPPMFRTPEEMQVAIDKYFEGCDQKQWPYTVTGLALAMGFDNRQSLLDYSKKDEFTCTIKRAKARVQDYAERQLFIGKNQVGTIFALKNNFGWQDKYEHETKIYVNNAEMISAARQRALLDQSTIDVECIPCADNDENNDL